MRVVAGGALHLVAIAIVIDANLARIRPAIAVDIEEFEVAPAPCRHVEIDIGPGIGRKCDANGVIVAQHPRRRRMSS